MVKFTAISPVRKCSMAVDCTFILDALEPLGNVYSFLIYDIRVINNICVYHVSIQCLYFSVKIRLKIIFKTFTCCDGDNYIWLWLCDND